MYSKVYNPWPKLCEMNVLVNDAILLLPFCADLGEKGKKKIVI
jgi:hypothetical protein